MRVLAGKLIAEPDRLQADGVGAANSAPTTAAMRFEPLVTATGLAAERP